MTRSCPRVIRNDAVSWDQLIAMDVDAFIVGPGPGVAWREKDIGVSRAVIRHATVPVLGVCLGHQILALELGLPLRRLRLAAHGRESTIHHTQAGLFAGIRQDFVAMRYHSWFIRDPGKGSRYATDAWTDDGVLMGIRDLLRPRFGVQFHPESVATEHGMALLENFLSFARKPRWRPRPLARPAVSPNAPPQASVHTRRLGQVAEPIHAIPRLARALSVHENYVLLDGHASSRSSQVSVAAWTSPHSLNQVVHALDANEIASPLASTVDGSQIPGFFKGGLLGWIPYEFGEGQPAALLRTHRFLVLQGNELWAVAIGCDKALDAWWAEASAIASDLDGANLPRSSLAGSGTPLVAPPRQDYLAAVEECKTLLELGESYELCLTTSVDFESTSPLWRLFEQIRQANPSRYSAIMRLDETEVICASPEMLLQIQSDRTVVSEPIKGTADRHPKPDDDARLRDSLATNPKDRAENLMIVDLTRHDLTSVAQPGTVVVTDRLRIDSLPRVHQLVSRIEAKLRPECTAVDALAAVFPPGSMTGAPKIRSVECLERIEGRTRGIYAGGIGYFSLDGTGEWAVVIRSLTRRGTQASVGCGGAITVLSDPAAEYAEAMSKAASILAPIGRTFSFDEENVNQVQTQVRRVDQALTRLLMERLLLREQLVFFESQASKIMGGQSGISARRRLP